VCGAEDSIVQKYLEVQTLKLRTSIQASYSVVVKSELTNKWGQSTRQSLLNILSQVNKNDYIYNIVNILILMLVFMNSHVLFCIISYPMLCYAIMHAIGDCGVRATARTAQ
jgi:hypothetical protein